MVCFLPATLAYGCLHGMPVEHLNLAEHLVKTCYEMYNQTESGLSAEIVFFNLANPDRNDFYIKVTCAHCPGRRCAILVAGPQRIADPVRSGLSLSLVFRNTASICSPSSKAPTTFTLSGWRLPKHSQGLWVVLVDRQGRLAVEEVTIHVHCGCAVRLLQPGREWVRFRRYPVDLSVPLFGP